MSSRRYALLLAPFVVLACGNSDDDLGPTGGGVAGQTAATAGNTNSGSSGQTSAAGGAAGHGVGQRPGGQAGAATGGAAGATTAGSPSAKGGASGTMAGAPSTAAGAPSTMAGAPSTAAGAPDGGTAGAPDQGIAGAPDGGSAGAPDSGTAGAPDSGTAGAPDSGSAGAPDSGTAGAPDSGSAGAPNSGTAGAPNSGTAGAPNSGTAGAPSGGAAGAGGSSNLPGGAAGAGGAAITSLPIVAAGDSFSCLRTATGAAKCWGQNDGGQLGNNKTQDSRKPVDVSGLGSGVRSIAAGFHANTAGNGTACALLTTGKVKCWGEGIYGELGDNDTSDWRTPVDVQGLTSVSSISVSGRFGCAVTTGGALACWGFNMNGELGINSTQSTALVPTAVKGLSSGVVAVSAGLAHACAVTSAGAVWCWGSNSDGALGNGGGAAGTIAPVAVPTLTSGVVAIAAGDNHTCALTDAGGVKCWGWNGYGQLGNGAMKDSPVPVDVTGLDAGVASISAGVGITCAVLTSGKAQCWGDNSDGGLGLGTDDDNSTVPADVFGFDSGVASISVGTGHACAVLTSGGVRCWGTNYFGELGDNSQSSTSDPAVVYGFD